MGLSPGAIFNQYGEAAFEKYSEKYFKSHRDTPDGKNSRYWGKDFDPESEDKFRKNYDAINWDSKKKTNI